jgi:calcineurin-like phosphoesterase family protein
LNGEILSHIPIHLDSLWREKKNKNWLNIHAHLHQKYVTLPPNHMQMINGMRSEDPRYFSVCVERIGYKPISIDEIRNLTNPKSVV